MCAHNATAAEIKVVHRVVFFSFLFLSRPSLCAAQDVALLPNGEVNTQNRALHVSLYAKFLSRWLHVFPRRQLHIVDGGTSRGERERLFISLCAKPNHPLRLERGRGARFCLPLPSPHVKRVTHSFQEPIRASSSACSRLSRRVAQLPRKHNSFCVSTTSGHSSGWQQKQSPETSP